MTPVFSFLIANYNTRPYAREMLESLKAQTFQEWEAIIVDDASKDGGIGDIVDELKDERFKYICLNRNMGASYARNLGFKKCVGKYIVIVDSDDMLMPEYLAEMNRVFQQNPEATLGFVDLEYFGSQNMVVKRPLKRIEDLALEQWIPHGGLCMTRETMEKSGGYYPGEELRHGNLDWDFILSIAQNTPLNIVHVPAPLYRYRQHNRNMTLSRAFHESITRECMYRRHKDFFHRYGQGERFLANGYYESAAVYWGKGEYGEAIRLAAHGAQLDPPAKPLMDSMELAKDHIGQRIARNEVRLNSLGSGALMPTEQNFTAYRELAQAYAALNEWDKAKSRIGIALGMALGNNLYQLAADFSSWLALVEEQLGNHSEAREAAEFALLCHPYNREALAYLLKDTINAGKANLAFQYLKPWLKVTNFSILKNVVPIFAILNGIKQMDFNKIQSRLKEIASMATKKNELDFREKIYASPVGRRAFREYRAKDLFETYGKNDGGHDILRLAVELSGAKNVLEIGCGNGRNLAALSALGLDCTGQDISSSALELAIKRKLPNVTLLNRPLQELELRKDEFDLVVSNRVIMHIPLNEIGRMLDIMANTGKYIYINEMLPSDPDKENWYIKKYDFVPELEKRGFRLVKKFETGRVGTPMLFKKIMPDPE